MSKERPIIFSAPMVRAILEGRKSMTRRVVKPQPEYRESKSLLGHYATWAKGWNIDDSIGRKAFVDGCPYGVPGDRLWVRETWKPHAQTSVHTKAIYRADYELSDGPGGWTPSIYMPRWASRITLEITAIRVERLQEITNQDAQKEGPPWANPHRHGPEGLEFDEHPGKIIRDPYADRHNTGINDCWICAFRMIWSDINGPGSWDLNPWVWVIEFGRIA